MIQKYIAKHLIQIILYQLYEDLGLKGINDIKI